MDVCLKKLLTNRSDEVAAELAKRTAGLTPHLSEEERLQFAQEVMTALGILVIDQKLQAALSTLEGAVDHFFAEAEQGSTALINTLLLSRYILLAMMVQESDVSFNSIEAFGYLNEVFSPLITTFYEQHRSDQPPPVPAPFASACSANLGALDFAGIGFVMLDELLTVIYFSRAAERLLGRSADEVLGHPFFDLFFDLRETPLFAAVEAALRQGKSEELHNRTLPLGGRKAALDVKVEPMRNDAKQIVGCTLLFHDVNRDRLRDQQAFRYEKYFENILNDAADAIILLNENHRVIMWNKAAETLFGYSEAEMFGKGLTRLVPEDPTAQSAMAAMDEQVLSRGFVRNQRLDMRTREGRIVHVELTRTALRNERGDFIGSSVILRDISEQEQLRRQVIQSEKLSAVGTLAAGIAHEVGTPLTSISALAQILQLKTDNPEFKEKLLLIQQSIERISRTVRTLVDFSRPITDKVEEIYLNHVIEHVIRIIKYDKRLKHQEIVTRLQPDLPLVRAGFDQLLQVFINICLNAADAMEGKPDGRLEITTWSEGKRVIAAVTDNGCGIAEEHIGHIFEPFFTTKKSGKGTGLGLWVSYNIIAGFGGDIKVRSTLGAGTTFTITLPSIS